MKLKRSKDYRFIAMVYSGDAEYPDCALRIGAFGWLLTAKLPRLIKPDVLAVRGKYNYDELIERRYGVYLFETHLNVCYGRGDANGHRDIHGKEQRWSCFLPWEEWRHVRHTLYDLKGQHFHTAFDATNKEPAREQYDAFCKARELCPKASFLFNDFDGEEITASTFIEEREWKRGTGRFKWLSLFWKPQVRRSLDIQFSAETGKQKGSWKGGTVGHSIDMLQGELHTEAFQRYCNTHGMTYIGQTI